MKPGLMMNVAADDTLAARIMGAAGRADVDYRLRTNKGKRKLKSATWQAVGWSGS